MNTPHRTPDHFPNAHEKLLDLIRKSPFSVKTLSDAAGVPYSSLQKWAKGKQRNFPLHWAERVHYAITGVYYVSPETTEEELPYAPIQ